MAEPFTIDDTPAGEARYTDRLRRLRIVFLDSSDAVTSDPIEYAIAAFSAATPTDGPGYVHFPSPIAWARLYRRWNGGPLFAYVRVMTRPIEPLMKLDGWSGWEYRDGAMCEPSDEQVAEVPTMLTSTLLLFHIPPDRLHTPVDAPVQLTVADAKASVHALVSVLNEQVRPVLNQMEGGL